MPARGCKRAGSNAPPSRSEAVTTSESGACCLVEKFAVLKTSAASLGDCGCCCELLDAIVETETKPDDDGLPKKLEGRASVSIPTTREL